jgi:metal-dependent HD superfamily phosphatase/phosphodiesterase
MSNVMAVERLKYNDHGPVHAKISSGAALEIFDLPSWGLALEVRKLAETSEKYFPLDNPDSYVLEAIST